MLNRMSFRAGLTIVVLLLGACSSAPFKTEMDYDHDVSFNDLRTWAWISANPMITPNPSANDNPLWENRIMQLVEAEMGSKGYRLLANPNEADMILAFTIGQRDKIKVNSYPTTYRGGYGYGGHRGWGGAYYGTETTVRNYTEGTVAFDVFDGKSHNPIWHGRAFGNVKASRTQEERQQIAQAIVTAVFSQFPPF